MSPAEVPILVHEWMKGIAPFVATESFWPTRTFQLIDLNDSLQTLIGDRLWFSLEEFVFDRLEPLGLATANPQSLAVLPSRLKGEELTQSSMLSSAETGSNSLRAWNRFRRRAKTHMHAGTVYPDANDGGSYEYPHHQYTDGALELAKQGIGFVFAPGMMRSVPLQISNDRL